MKLFDMQYFHLEPCDIPEDVNVAVSNFNKYINGFLEEMDDMECNVQYIIYLLDAEQN